MEFGVPRRKILHITVHLGGGMGSVLLKYLAENKGNKNYSHQIITLGYMDEYTKKAARSLEFPILENMASDHPKIKSLAAEADIVLIHWWNHPLHYDFLVRNVLPECRIVMWSHVSGLHSPQVFTNKVFDYADMFVFTTPISFESEIVKSLSQKQRDSLRVVWSTGGVAHLKSIRPKKHAGFNIGYIGTVDYAKINRNFIKICSRIDIPDVKFTVCGGPNERELQREAYELGVANKFNFTGHVSDIRKYISSFDVFGYPLSPYHYGTCDQVLAESMAAGVVPVVLQNPMEKYMVKDGVTGIIAKNENEYVKAIHTLYRDLDLKRKLAQNARKHAMETFSLTKMTRDWEDIFEEALHLPKTSKKWDIAERKIKPANVFIESLGEIHGKDFLRHYTSKSETTKKRALQNISQLGKLFSWQSKTKGTVHNYHAYFPEDKHLDLWSRTILGNN